MRAVFHIFILLMLTSCGFKPVLSQNSDGYHILEHVKLVSVDGQDQPRINRIIRENLGDDLGVSPLYTLTLKVNNELSATGTMKDSQSTRYKVKVTFEYHLSDIETREEINHGSIYLYSSYDVAESEFANYVAERYTNDNLLKQLCDELKERLILVLSTRSN
jgi:hypothetical protein